MTNADLMLSRDQRDEIMKAVKAIERQVTALADKSNWPALYVITSNLAIIQTNLTNLPQASLN
jgi:hypothetical protein